jgi:hypothetical protein
MLLNSSFDLAFNAICVYSPGSCLKLSNILIVIFIDCSAFGSVIVRDYNSFDNIESSWSTSYIRPRYKINSGLLSLFFFQTNECCNCIFTSTIFHHHF